jgi:hypothetical protein
MKTIKLRIIQGGRDALEASLAKALFQPDTTEINRISSQINAIQENHPSKLTLVRTPNPSKSTHKK